MNVNSFDRLVSNISQNERKRILSRIRTQINAEALSLEAAIDRSLEPVGGSLEEHFNAESLFLRVWLFLKSIFLNNAIDNIYKAYLLSRIARRLAKKYSSLLDFSRGVFLHDMYNKSLMLKRAADFFRTTLSIIDSNPGDFYVFLGTFFVPLISERFKSEVDPYNFPLGWANPGELHITQIRKLEKIMQTIDPNQRAHLASAVQSAHWLKQFCNLPFRRFLTQFSNQGAGVCKFSTVSKDINEFAKVLCNSRPIQRELLEALYLFNNQYVLDEEEENLPEHNAEAEEFVTQAASQIKTIRSYLNDVPIQSIGTLMHHSVDWVPSQPDTADDWFLKFKANWRRVFDRKWNSWLADQQIEAVHRQLEILFGLDSIPLLPNRPWSTLRSNVAFKYDYSLGFLAYFFKNVFPKYTQILKIILLEGKFYQSDQRITFTDALDNLLQQEKNLDTLMNMLSEQGEYGKHFVELADSAAFARAKIDALMEKIEETSEEIVHNFLKGTASLSTILDAYDPANKNSNNISTIQITFQNEKAQAAFIQRLKEIKENTTKVIGLLNQIGDLSEPAAEPKQKPSPVAEAMSA